MVEHSGGVFGVLHGRTAQQQMRTWWFVLTTLFSIIMMLRINYFVATIGTQYQYIFGSIEISDSLNKFFDIALPLGGIVSVPFIGLFLDNYSSLTVLSWLLGISLTIGVLGLLLTMAWQLLEFVCLWHIDHCSTLQFPISVPRSLVLKTLVPSMVLLCVYQGFSTEVKHC